MGNVKIIDHAMIKHKMSFLKDKNTGTKLFRELINEIAIIMACEITRDLPLKEVEVETPLMKSSAEIISGRKLALVPILRAGIGMVDGFLAVIPNAKVGHVGLYRDPETLKPVEYFCKLPVDIEERDIIILDPMLATGGSSEAAIQFLKERGKPRSIKLACILGCPEGLEFVTKHHPDVDVYVGYMDKELNSHGYILPGLGDAGDRLFGTK